MYICALNIYKFSWCDDARVRLLYLLVSHRRGVRSLEMLGVKGVRYVVTQWEAAYFY